MAKLSQNISFYLRTLNSYIHYKSKRYIPFLVIINPTTLCNLNCKYCSSHNNNPHKMGIDNLFRIVDDVSRLGTASISISGGEPLLVKRIEEAGIYARKKKLRANLNTNGTLIDEKRAFRIANSFDSVRISLNGFEKTHDKISGVKGTYKRVLKTLDYLTAAPHRHAKIGINFVLTQYNKHDASEFCRQFKDKVDFISFLPEFSFVQNQHQKFSKPGLDIYALAEQLNMKGKSGNTKQFIVNGKLDYTKKICDAGKLYISIHPNGKIYACPFVSEENMSNYFLGSVYADGIANSLKNVKKTYFSDGCIGCYATCSTEISRIFRMQPYELIKNFQYLKKTYHI